MAIEIKIPSMGESVTEATIARIMKENGALVRAEEEILEIETDKVNQVLYASHAGKVSLQVKVGEIVKIGQVIGSIDTSVSSPSPTEPVKTAPTPAEPIKSTPAPTSNSRESVTEFVQKIQVPSPKPIPAAPPVVQSENTKRKRMSQLRKVIATRLVEAKNQTAMLTTFNEVDMSTIMEIRTKEKDPFFKKHGVKLGFMSFFVKGVVAALKAIPQINASLDGDEIIEYTSYDIGVAVSTERGLMVPVLRQCDQLDFGGIESALEVYAKKAREGSISVDDLKGGSFTITNGGVFGSLLSTPILNPPQSAILGMHSIVKRPVVVDDAIVIRPMMYIALSYDHRIVDGKEAVLFLVNLKQTLEEPTRLLLDL